MSFEVLCACWRCGLYNFVGVWRRRNTRVGGCGVKYCGVCVCVGGEVAGSWRSGCVWSVILSVCGGECWQVELCRCGG